MSFCHGALKERCHRVLPLLLSLPRRPEVGEPLPQAAGPMWGCPRSSPQGSSRSCLSPGRQLELPRSLHKVIWGTCGRAANVVVLALNTRSLFPVLFLTSLWRSTKVLAARCFHCNYKVIFEACGVWVTSLRGRCLHCLQRKPDIEIKISDSSIHSFCVYTVFLGEWNTVQLWKSMYFACNKHDAVQ